jgi:predicted molibdopterin-dependent oxidoreductase YjgC
MSEILVQIDGKEVKATEGMTVLEAAQSAGISIPTLCHHEKLEPFGGCRLCIVEVQVGDWTKRVVSCVYTVEENLIVRTRSEKIDKIRKMILELQRNTPKNTAQTKTVLKKRPHFAFIVAYVSDIVPRSSKRMRLDLLTAE